MWNDSSPDLTPLQQCGISILFITQFGALVVGLLCVAHLVKPRLDVDGVPTSSAICCHQLCCHDIAPPATPSYLSNSPFYCRCHSCLRLATVTMPCSRLPAPWSLCSVLPNSSLAPRVVAWPGLLFAPRLPRRKSFASLVL